MSKTIKNNLFRFVTLRNPQLIDKKENKPGFVFHPDEKSGTFFSSITNADPKDRKDLLKQKAEDFIETALKTRTEARSINEKLYLFSSWLMRHKNALSFVDIKKNSEDVGVLDTTQLLSVWDNLIYQTIEKKSTYVREAMIQLLVANQFLEEFLRFSEDLSDDITFTEDQEKEFIRRANASVVMSKLLFSDTKISQNQKRVATQEQTLRSLDFGEIVVTKERIKRKKTLLKELKQIEVDYIKTTAQTSEAAFKVHKELVEQLKDDAEVIIEETNPETGRTTTRKTYPGLKLPEFEFTPDEPINKSYLSGKLSDESLSEFLVSNLENYDTFSEVEKAIKTSMSNDQKVVTSKTPKTPKKVNVGGATFRANNPLGNAFDYNISPLSGIYPSGEREIFMLVFNYVQDSPIQSINYTITFDNDSEISESAFEITSSNIDTTFVKLFPSLIAFPSGTQNYTLKGQITLEDNRVLSFDKFVDIKSRSNFGMFDVKTDSETPTEVSIKPELFGVTNLGIADFRRVEQEVCCYVPGEVSHIENVMAREYKERSTRNLVSSEVTTEKTDERERENLSDTTSTERNEMQTEVSSVLNEDQTQAQGGNANMSYNGTVSFSAGAYFDSSSSSSASNSNSLAQTYAQEVTERAMERIVQKTQTKRTSRILKEFEENNKHGFDNTKGSQHVTGVYRWVDKIYKNTLINYGKRLMYEFAIPEPSRFFKEAIWKQIENNEAESTIIIPDAPIHPNDYEFAGQEFVKSAADITEDNYQELAAQYNAEVSEPPIQSTHIGKAFSYLGNPSGSEWDENTSEAVELEIPEGYYTVYAKANWYDSADNHINNSVVLVGEKRILFNSSSYPVSVFLPPFMPTLIDNYTEKIPISVSQLGNLSGSVNVSIGINRLPETLEKWKNETYHAIMNAYNERLQEYNDAQNQDIIPFVDKEKIQFNPLHNRSLEKNEIKRIAIELLAKPYEVVTAKDDYISGSNLRVQRDQAFQNHASAVKFFEQAFDWDIMAYIFYPYFYGKEANWKELFQAQDAADPLFQAFLQSGMARAVIPVRPGFEDAVNWYMETGEIWNGQGLVVDQDDDLYVSVAEEMQTIEGVVEGTWETRLPTALTILQAESASLLEGGLPCFCDEYSNDNTIMSSSELLSGDDGSAGVGVDLLD
ncbi:hypothetical protein [Psychroserpens algicola]|uniref:Uncharacterized protein n=1 Tax=Psychroserpens algicola TaxID=1719034 RepID=A0ABT0HBJ4_9FLAO|nr:hypothetical protein [Psychroserpens algicola]MCK8481733.1 hypothetical protein [Psychroserpens algicola]